MLNEVENLKPAKLPTEELLQIWDMMEWITGLKKESNEDVLWPPAVGLLFIIVKSATLDCIQNALKTFICCKLVIFVQYKFSSYFLLLSVITDTSFQS